MPEILIGDRRVGPDQPPFLIAEAGINHNGDAARAMEMVRVAKVAGADAIKFQTFTADAFVGDPFLTYTYRSQGREVTESMLAMFRRCELPRGVWADLKAESDRVGITFLSTPQNPEDLDLLLEVGVPAIKVGSDDFTNLPLLQRFASAGLPLLLSCGMADLAEVSRTLEVIGAPRRHPAVLLLCTSQYPTPAEDVNLRKLVTLRAAFPSLVLGFSDHTEGTLASALAVALGASVFEKHFTLDRDLPGPDHWFSANPAELEAWTRAVRTARTMQGDGEVTPTPMEKAMRPLARRSIVALCPIARGDAFTTANVGVRRPGTGLPPEVLGAVLGRHAARAMRQGEPVGQGDIAT
jgi:sialic acid synthase SpsE